MANLDGFKVYYVASGDLSDAELNLCMNAAKRYFANAGAAEPEQDDPLYDLGIYRLATFYADHRGAISDGMGDAVPYGIGGIILQLRESAAETGA